MYLITTLAIELHNGVHNGYKVIYLYRFFQLCYFPPVCLSGKTSFLLGNLTQIKPTISNHIYSEFISIPAAFGFLLSAPSFFSLQSQRVLEERSHAVSPVRLHCASQHYKLCSTDTQAWFASTPVQYPCGGPLERPYLERWLSFSPFLGFFCSFGACLYFHHKMKGLEFPRQNNFWQHFIFVV